MKVLAYVYLNRCLLSLSCWIVEWLYFVLIWYSDNTVNYTTGKFADGRSRSWAADKCNIC